jgi:hypothetical protein
MLSAVFVYLDRVYSNGTTGIASIRELAISSFQKGIWENELLFQKTRDDFLAWAAAERKEGKPDEAARPTIIAITALSKLLDRYTSLLTPYQNDAIGYYTAQAEANIWGANSEEQSMSPTRYVEWAMEKVEEERERVATCLDPDSVDRLVLGLRVVLGGQVKDKIVGRGESAESLPRSPLTLL